MNTQPGASSQQTQAAYEEAARQRRAANLQERVDLLEQRLATLTAENAQLRRRIEELEAGRG